MVRVVIENVLLFLLPTLLYIGYVWLRRGGQKSPQTPQDILEDAPLFWLLAAGALTVMLVIFVFSTSDGGKPGQGYVPPRAENGKIIPGHRQ